MSVAMETTNHSSTLMENRSHSVADYRRRRGRRRRGRTRRRRR